MKGIGMDNKLPFWCKSCWQEFDVQKINGIASETPTQAHKRIWKQSMTGRCDNPQVELKPPKVVRPRIRRETPPALPEVDMLDIR